MSALALPDLAGQMTNVVAIGGPRLHDLAQAIEHEHQATLGAFRTTLDHAIRCGELLIQAKAQVPHGQWLPWVKANLTLKLRQCQVCMRIAEKREALNAQSTAHLTIDGALALIAETRQAHPPGFGSVERYTAAPYLECARQVLGEFDLDPASCSIAQEHVRARSYFTADDDGLAQEWHGKVWLNPPYTAVGKFVDKLLAELSAGRATEALLLVNAYTETKWFHRAASMCAAIAFPVGRVHFALPDSDEMKQPAYGSAFIYYGPNVSRFRAAFAGLGLIMIPDSAGARP
jgi:phage N-6-adenine-methyltransferase